MQNFFKHEAVEIAEHHGEKPFLKDELVSVLSPCYLRVLRVSVLNLAVMSK